MFLLAVFLSLIAAVFSANNDNLLAVVQIFRHGQRTPVSSYPNDPYNDPDTYWAGLAPGQLTNEGKRQHYTLGQFSRKRYSDWLPSVYNNSDIYVQTTDVDRTHMSAQANLFGLYPASGTQVWKSGETWQPIPIHPSDPKVVYSENTDCPAFLALVANVTEESEFKSLDLTYASVYNYLSTQTGSNITDFNEAAAIYDPLLIEDLVGYTLPDWTYSVYPEPLRSLRAKFFAAYTYTTQMKRLYIGPLLNDIMEYFDDKVAGTSSLQYKIYSAHDAQSFAILDTIGPTPGEPVPFAVSLWFELRLVNGVNVVNLWMRSDETLTQLSISNCALDCPLTEVKSLLEDVLIDVDTWEAECALTSS